MALYPPLTLAPYETPLPRELLCGLFSLTLEHKA